MPCLGSGRASFPFIRNIPSITQDLIHGARPVGAEKSSGYAILNNFSYFVDLFWIVRGKTFVLLYLGLVFTGALSLLWR